MPIWLGMQQNITSELFLLVIYDGYYA